MAVYFVTPTAPGEEQPTPADSGDYTYDLRPAPMRQEARIADMEAKIGQLKTQIADLENEQQIQAAEHGDALASLAARLDRLEEPARRTRETLAALFGDGRLSPKAGGIVAGNGGPE